MNNHITTHMKSISIAVVDDHLLMRQGLISLLKEFEQINILFDVSNGLEMLDQLKIHKPDIVLLDIEMPVMNGRKALTKMQEIYPDIKIIILSTHYSDAFIDEYIAIGANGFMPKESDIEIIIASIKEVYENGYYFDSKVTPGLVSKLRKRFKAKSSVQSSSLTDQERKIIKLFCMGKSAVGISEELFISKRTVEWHKENIYRKLEIRNTAELIKYALMSTIITEKEILL